MQGIYNVANNIQHMLIIPHNVAASHQTDIVTETALQHDTAWFTVAIPRYT